MVMASGPMSGDSPSGSILDLVLPELPKGETAVGEPKGLSELPKGLSLLVDLKGLAAAAGKIKAKLLFHWRRNYPF